VKHRAIILMGLAVLAVFGLALFGAASASGLLGRALESYGPPEKIDPGPFFSGVKGAVVRGGDFNVEPSSFAVGDLSQTDIDNAGMGSWDPTIGFPGIGDGTNVTVNAIAVDQHGNVYVGGDFHNAGGVGQADYIAKWNVKDGWSALPDSPVTGTVNAIAVDQGGGVWIGGQFTKDMPSGNDVYNIVRWDGSSWARMRKGVNGPVNAIAVAPEGVYLGGDFTQTTSGIAAKGIILWSWGLGDWQGVGGGVTDDFGEPGSVNALAVNGSDLYVGGDFAKAGTVEADYLALWDGASWHSLGDVLTPGQVVDALATSGEELYVASRNQQLGGFHFWQITNPWDCWNEDWTDLASSDNTEDRIYAAAASQNNIFVGGKFTSIGGESASWVAHWNSRDDGTWHAMGSGVTGPSGPNDGVYALALDGPNLYVGGTFTSAGGDGANRLARWLQPVADLAVYQRTSPPGVVHAGDQIDYQVTIRNKGYVEATDVELVDVLPEDVTLDEPACELTGEPPTCVLDLGNLPRGATTTRSFKVTIPPTTTDGTVLTNTVSVMADQYDPVLGGPFLGSNVHTLETTVRALAVLSLTKQAPADAEVGEEITYKLAVTNSGPSTANSVVLTDTLPSGVLFKVASCPGDPDNCQYYYDEGSHTVTWNWASMPPSGPGSSKTAEFTVVPFVVGELENNASVSAREAEPAKASPSRTAVTGTPGLSILKTDGVSEVGLNAPLTYTIQAWVFGTPQVTQVRITDTLPATVDLQSATSSQGKCSGNGTVICDVGTLQAAEWVTVTLAVVPTQEGLLENVAQIGGYGVESESSTDDDTSVKNWADLSLVKTGPDAATAGVPFDYVITVENHGPASTTGVEVTDDLPDGVYLNSANSTEFECSYDDPVSARVTCALDTLANRASAQVILNVTPLAQGTIENTASVTSAKYDDDSSNNEDTVSTPVVPGEPQTITLRDLTIKAYKVVDDEGRLKAIGVVSLGEHFYFPDPSDYLICDTPNLKLEAGPETTLSLKVGDLEIFQGEFTSSAEKDWALTLDGESLVEDLARFTLASSELTDVYLLSGQVNGSTEELVLNPPGNNVTVGASFTITPGPNFEGNITDRFTLTAGGFQLEVPSGATLDNAGVHATPISLVMPAYFGSGEVAGAKMRIYYSSDRADTPTLKLTGPEGEAAFGVPDLLFNSAESFKITGGQGRLVCAGGVYALQIEDSRLVISLPGNPSVTIPPSESETLGVVWLKEGEIDTERLPLFKLDVAGAELQIAQAILQNEGLSRELAVLQWPQNLGSAYGNVSPVRITPQGLPSCASEESCLIIHDGGEFGLPDIVAEAWTQEGNTETLRVNGPVGKLVEENDGYALDIITGSAQVRLLQQNDRTVQMSGAVDPAGQFSGSLAEDTLTLDVAAAELTLSGLSTDGSLDDVTGLSTDNGTWQLPDELGGGSKSFAADIIVDGSGLHINGGNSVDFPDAKLHADGYPVDGNQAILVEAADRTYKLDLSGTISVSIPGAGGVVAADLTLDSLGNFNGSASGLALPAGGLTWKADGFDVQNGRLLVDKARLAAPAEFGGDEIILDQMTVLDKGTGLDFGSTSVVGAQGDAGLAAQGARYEAGVALPSLNVLGSNIFELRGSFEEIDRLPIDNPDGKIDGYKITAHGAFSMPDFGLEDDGQSRPRGSQDGGLPCDGIEVDVELIVGESGSTILTVRPSSDVLAALLDSASAGPGSLEAGDLSLRAIAAAAQLSCAIPLDATGLQLSELGGEFQLDKDLDLLVIGVGFSVETVVGVPPPIDRPYIKGTVEADITIRPYREVYIHGNVRVLDIFEAGSAEVRIRPEEYDLKASVTVRQPLYLIGVVEGTLGFHTWLDPSCKAHFTGWGSVSLEVQKGSLVHEEVLGLCCVDFPPFSVLIGRADVEFGEFRANGGSVWGIKGKIDILDLLKTGIYIDAKGTVDFTDVDSYVLLDNTQLLRARQAWLRQERIAEGGGGADFDRKHRSYLPLILAGDGERRGPAPTSEIESYEPLEGYELLAFASDAIIRTVPVISSTDMAFMLVGSSAVPTLTLVTPSGLDITPDNYTSFEGVGYWETYADTVDINGNVVPLTQTTYLVAEAEEGDWQVVLHGDIAAEDRFVLSVVGAKPLPTLAEVTASSTGPTSADVTWRLFSEVTTTTLNIHATPGPITATYAVTTSEGMTETVTREVYSGLPVAVDVETPLNGDPGTASLDLSQLESGTYWIWVEADDHYNAPLRVYAPSPIAVDNSESWPLTWTPSITVTPEYLGLHIAWDPLQHPDRDGYRVYVSDSPITGGPSLGHTTVITTHGVVTRAVNAPASTHVNTWLEPGRIHYVVVEAYDEDSGRTVRSQDVTGVPRGAEFELSTPTPLVTVTGGSSTSMELLVTRTGDVTPTIALYADAPPDGLDVVFGSTWVVPTDAGTSVLLNISASDTLPGGTYTVTTVAAGGGISRTLDIQVAVNEPYFELVAMPDSIALHENESQSVSVLAIGHYGESDPINLELSVPPRGLLWTLSSDVVYPGVSVTLVVTDTFLVEHGQYELHVVGDDGENEYDLLVPLDIIEPRFDLVAAQDELTVTTGYTATFTLEVIEEHGWTDPVTLALDESTLPPGSGGGFALTLDDLPQPQLTVTPTQTVYLLLETGLSTPEDLYLLTVDASSDERQVSLDLLLWVFATSSAPVVEAGSDQTVKEGDTVSLGPATFTDAESGDIHTATIDWGDATGVLDGIVAESNGAGTVSGSHIYVDNGGYTVTVTVCDNHAVCGADHFSSTVTNVAPTIAVSGAASVDEGALYTLLLGTITDPGEDTVTECVVHWGDGSTDTCGAGGEFSHTYGDNGSYTISVDLTDEDGSHSGAGSLDLTVINVAPGIGWVTLSPGEIDENDTITLVTQFTDPGADSHTAVIEWADGDSDTVDVPFGRRVFTVTHQYLDDDPTGTPRDFHTIQVTVTDDDTGSDSATATVTVYNVAPDITAVTPSPAEIDENDTVTLVTRFTDPGPDTHTAVIEWADGVSDTVDLAFGTRVLTVTHQYLDDDPTGTPSDEYTIEVTVTDDDTGSDGATATVTVNNVAPQVTATGSTIDENGSATVSGAFSDPGTQDTFTVEIDWGEGSPQLYEYQAGTTSYTETHQYLDDNPTGTPSDIYDILVTVTDDDIGVGEANTIVTVNNVAPQVTATGDTIDENGWATLGGSITDPGTEDTFSVEIAWGEGITQTFMYGAGTTLYTETHQYLDDNPTGTPSDDYAIHVTVTDDDGGVGEADTIVTVDNVDPVSTIDSIIDEFGTEIEYGVRSALILTELDVAGSFTDVGTLDTHTAVINWDDGIEDDLGPVMGTIAVTHTYADRGDYTITLTITDDDEGVGTATKEIRVLDAEGATQEAIDKLIPLAEDDPNIAAALDRLRGDNGGRAENGALDLLEKGNLIAALGKIKQALQYLEAAEAADPSLDLDESKSFLALAAKSTANDAILQAEGAATKPNELRKIARANELVAEGDTLSGSLDYVGAVAKYQEAVREVQGIY